MPPPIIRIEVEAMRAAMVHAFSQQCLEIDQQFQVAIEVACQPDNVQRILSEAAARYIKEAVDSEIKSYFLYGDGRKAIAAEVARMLEAKEFHG